MRKKLSRRNVLKGSAALAAGALFAQPLRAAAPEPSAVTPALIEAARREGKIAFYSALELNTSERFAKAFETKYPGIAVRVERSGAERVFQRIGQEYSSNIHAVDVVISTNPAHMLIWTQDKLLAPYLTEDMAKHLPADIVNPDGLYATVCSWLGVVGYNTNLVKPEDAPKSFADLLDPKWKGKMVKGHPSYSGAILTTTFVLARDLGWPYLEKLALQKVMQVQSAADPPKKLALGERAVMADGGEYLLCDLKSRGEPVEPIYPTEGTPLVTGPSGIMVRAPNPNAARLFYAWSMTAEAQQLNVDVGALRSAHRLAKDRPDMRKFADIKTLKEEASVVADKADEIKAHYVKIFKV